MVLVEIVLGLYTFTVLGVTGVVEALTGLYPREQLAILQELAGVAETSGFLDVTSSLSSRG